MDQNGLDALVVVDKDCRLRGIVERERLVSTLISSSVKDVTASRQ